MASLRNKRTACPLFRGRSRPHRQARGRDLPQVVLTHLNPTAIRPRQAGLVARDLWLPSLPSVVPHPNREIIAGNRVPDLAIVIVNRRGCQVDIAGIGRLWDGLASKKGNS